MVSIASLSPPIEWVRKLFHGELSDFPELSNFEETRFLLWLEKNGIESLLYFYLNKYKVVYQNTLKEKLRKIANSEAALDLALVGELKKILTILGQNGISPILFKGAALSISHYPKPSLRPRCDVDMILSEDHFNKAVSIFKEQGYQIPKYQPGDKVSSGINLSKQEGGGFEYCYDLHSKISNETHPISEQLNYSYLLAKADIVFLLASNARVLDEGSALLLSSFHRAAHFAHMGERLIWLYDVHLLVESLDKNRLNQILAQARELDMDGLLGDALIQSNYWFGTALEDSLLQKIKNIPTSKTTEGYLLKNIDFRRREDTLSHLSDQQGWWNKMTFIFQKLFPSKGFMFYTYGKRSIWQLPFLYIKRFAYALSLLLKLR